MKKYQLIISALVLNIFCLYPQASFYQKGQIVTKSFDTINAYVEIAPSYQGVVHYKTNLDSNIQEIEIIKISSLMTPYNSFYNFTADKNELLFRIVVKGKIQLFETLYATSYSNSYRDKFAVTQYNPPSIIYAIKFDTIVYIINNKKDLAQLLPMIDKCPSAKEIISNKRFKLENLKSVALELNYCN